MSEQIACPTCGGSGHIVKPTYKPGDRVLWDTSSWWGTRAATVLKLSKGGKKVQIKTDSDHRYNGGNPWITYVSFAKLELASQANPKGEPK
jgi:hypothetical protein